MERTGVPPPSHHPHKDAPGLSRPRYKHPSRCSPAARVRNIAPDMTERPTGTATFLFTDIEGSTRRWAEEPDTMRVAVALHDATLKQAIESNAGWLFKHTGDGVVAAFGSPRGAINAAIAAQRHLELPVRMGICTGEAELRDDDYFGPALNRAARTMAAGHGGQVLVAASTAALAEGADLVDLGEFRLRDLSRQRLFQVRAEGLKQDFPPLRTLDLALGNLPAQAASLLGRDKQLAEIAQLLSTSRLVTLTGVGGVGKTRLAVHAAADVSSSYPDGVWLVEFAALRDAAAAGHAVAGVLGVVQQPAKTIEQSLISWLGRRKLLLVLDNCEHLIDAVVDLAREVLARCPNVTVLATSREALMVDGERSWPVPSLSVRDGLASPAVQLFVERARAVVPDFVLGGDGEVVGEICRRLDGIPLAIELAAARTRSMSPMQIRDRLEERFSLLTGGSRRTLERHQSLRQTVQWSFDLLSPQERVVLSRASVFAGDFTLEAAERVCASAEPIDVLDLLDSLVRKSLMTAVRLDNAMRYSLLETIRQFGEEQLVAMGEGDAVRLRHAQFFADDSVTQFGNWRSPRQLAAYEWLDCELDNLRSAFRWAVDHQCVDIAALIASNIGDMARFRLRDEAATWAAEIVDAARQIRHRRLAVLLTWATSSAWAFGRLDEAKRLGAEAISLVNDPDFDPFVWAYSDLGTIATIEGNIEKAIELNRVGAQQPGDRHDRFCQSMLLHSLALAGQTEEASEIADGVVAAAEATGIPFAICIAVWSMGKTFAVREPARALAAYERAMGLARQSGDRIWEMLIFPDLAALQAGAGDPVTALRSFKQMLEGWRGSVDLIVVSTGIGNLIVLLNRLGHAAEAATLHGTLAKSMDFERFAPELSVTATRLRSTLGAAAFDAAEQRGAAMSLTQTVAYSGQQIGRALAALGAETQP